MCVLHQCSCGPGTGLPTKLHPCVTDILVAAQPHCPAQHFPCPGGPLPCAAFTCDPAVAQPSLQIRISSALAPACPT